MKIDQVRNNLIQTIAGKEALSAGYWEAIRKGEMDTATGVAMLEFLKINIAELRRILEDVETCVFETNHLEAELEEAEKDMRKMSVDISNLGWMVNPDRMGQ